MKKQVVMPSAYQHITHTFDPVYDENAKVLILVSMPSVKSREQQFYYGHPQNRFWKVLARMLDEMEPEDIAQKRAFLLHNRIALWDVIASCDIVGSSDSSIKNVKENDMRVIFNKAKIQAIFLNGGKAYELFIKYCQQYIQKDAPKLVKLPSTSPANASWSLEELTDIWKKEWMQFSQ